MPSGSGGAVASASHTLTSFPEADIVWTMDAYHNMWLEGTNPDLPGQFFPSAAFRVDFLIARSGYTKLDFVKALMSSVSSVFHVAVYGSLDLVEMAGTTKIIEETVSPSLQMAKTTFDPIDISSYAALSVVMEPDYLGPAGDQTYYEPIKQSVYNIPPAARANSQDVILGNHRVFAGLVAHTYNTPFPASRPALLMDSPSRFLARWLAIGVH